MQAHLERLRPDSVLVIGDEDLLGPGAVEPLRRWTSRAERLDHEHAFDLATEPATRLPSSPIVFVTMAADPCTLLAAASAAGRLRALLLPLQDEELRPAQARWLTSYQPKRIVVVRSVTGAMTRDLRATGATVLHVTGDAPAIAEALAGHFPAKRVWLVRPRTARTWPSLQP